MTARFAPTDLTADLSKLTPADRQVLAKLIEASKIIDAHFSPARSGPATFPCCSIWPRISPPKAGRVCIISG